MSAWPRDPVFWNRFGCVLLHFRPERPQPRRTLEALLTVLGPVPGARVLDLGCGFGEHALELARRGYAVTGIDLREALLDRARQRSLAEGLELELLRESPDRFLRPGGFDAALALGWGFGGLFGHRDPLRLLTRVHANLRPRGQLVVEAQGLEVLARRRRPPTARRLPSGELWIDRRAPRKDWSALDLRWTLVTPDHQHEASFSLRIFSGRELESLLAAAGFRDVQLFGTPHGSPYDHRAETLLARARR